MGFVPDQGFVKLEPMQKPPNNYTEQVGCPTVSSFRPSRASDFSSSPEKVNEAKFEV